MTEKEFNNTYRVIQSNRIDRDYYGIQKKVKIDQPFKTLKTFLFLLHFKVDISDKYEWYYLNDCGYVANFPSIAEFYTSETEANKALNKLKKRVIKGVI